MSNGDLFEQRFNDLRRKRDRDDDAGARPFSRMHKYYVLLAGNRWAKVLSSLRSTKKSSN